LTCSEAWIAKIHNARSDTYKMATDDVFEYLDTEKPEAGESLSQAVSELTLGFVYRLKRGA
jgi:hypothetical protein